MDPSSTTERITTMDDAWAAAYNELRNALNAAFEAGMTEDEITEAVADAAAEQ